MACFNSWDIGDCGCVSCAPGFETQFTATMACCVCTANDSAYLSFNIALGGSSTYVLDIYSGIGGSFPWSGNNGWENSSLLYLNQGIYYWIFFYLANGTLCISEYTTGNNYTLTASSVISSGCSPPTAVYSITSSNVPLLFAAGITTITFNGTTSAQPNCNVVCVTCGFPYIPPILSISDAVGGPYEATWNSSLYLWVTSRLCSASSTSPTAKCTSGTAACNSGAHAAGALYTYSIGCTSANRLTLNRYWYELTCTSPNFQYSPCSCNPGGSQGYSSSGSVSVTCGSVSWSGTLTHVSGNLADPVGGTVSFTQ